MLILVSLANGSKHGYAMIEDIAAVSGIRLGPGTLYGAIARLEANRFIEPLPSDDRRRPYRLTGAGAEALQERIASMQVIADVGRRRLAQA
jgi:DNA-binding PadR family transcriptional regulator